MIAALRPYVMELRLIRDFNLHHQIAARGDRPVFNQRQRRVWFKLDQVVQHHIG